MANGTASPSAAPGSTDGAAPSPKIDARSVTTWIAAVTSSFAALGFLATRAYINFLGLPVHVSIAAESYTQYGGRFAFTLVIHLAIAGSLLALALAVLGRVSLPSRLTRGPYPWLGFFALVAATLLAELTMITATTRVFIPGQTLPPSPAASTRQMVALVGVEVLVLLTCWVAARRAAANGGSSGLTRAYVLVLSLACVLLLPVVYAGTAMRDEAYRYVSLVGEDGPIIGGVHAFTDQSDYYVWDDVDKRLVQIGRNSVTMVVHREAE